MKIRQLNTLVILGAMVLVTANMQAYADDEGSVVEKKDEKHRMIREETKDMTPEQREEYRQKKLEERLSKMTPEQRAAFEERRRARQEKWANLSPEERAEMKAKRREMQTDSRTPRSTE